MRLLLAQLGGHLKPKVAKAKGVETENFFVEFLKKIGIVNAERRRLNGALDKGDISGWVRQDGSKNVCVEVKSGAVLSIPEWIKEYKAETVNAGADVGFVAVRPKGKPDPSTWWAIMQMDDFIELLREAGYMHD